MAARKTRQAWSGSPSRASTPGCKAWTATADLSGPRSRRTWTRTISRLARQVHHVLYLPRRCTTLLHTTSSLRFASVSLPSRSLLVTTPCPPPHLTLRSMCLVCDLCLSVCAFAHQHGAEETALGSADRSRPRLRISPRRRSPPMNTPALSEHARRRGFNGLVLCVWGLGGGLR